MPSYVAVRMTMIIVSITTTTFVVVWQLLIDSTCYGGGPNLPSFRLGAVRCLSKQ